MYFTSIWTEREWVAYRRSVANVAIGMVEREIEKWHDRQRTTDECISFVRGAIQGILEQADRVAYEKQNSTSVHSGDVGLLHDSGRSR